MIRPLSAKPNLEQVRAAVQQRGLTAVARDLGMPRLSVASALLDISHAGTAALIQERWNQLSGQVTK